MQNDRITDGWEAGTTSKSNSDGRIAAVSLAPHLFHETMVHLLASIPNAHYLEYMDWNDDLWVAPVLPSKKGTMTPPERPGHGLAFRPDILTDCRISGQRMKP